MGRKSVEGERRDRGREGERSRREEGWKGRMGERGRRVGER